jgi:hypothetical protein
MMAVTSTSFPSEFRVDPKGPAFGPISIVDQEMTKAGALSILLGLFKDALTKESTLITWGPRSEDQVEVSVQFAGFTVDLPAR